MGHVTVLQLRGPMGLHVLQWCHPMLACAKRTSYCTRIITLYGAQKVDSGPRMVQVIVCLQIVTIVSRVFVSYTQCLQFRVHTCQSHNTYINNKNSELGCPQHVIHSNSTNQYNTNKIKTIYKQLVALVRMIRQRIL